MANVPASLNNLKTKIDDLDLGKFKTVPVDLKSNLVANEVVKKYKIQYTKDKIK